MQPPPEPTLDPSTRIIFALACLIGLILLIAVVLKHVPDPDIATGEAAARGRRASLATRPDEAREAIMAVSQKIGVPFSQVATYWDSFKRFDANGSGSVDAKELTQLLLDTIGFCPPPSEVEAMVRDADTDGNGTLEFHEFCELCKAIDFGEQTDEELRDAFMLWSENQDRIPEKVIRYALTHLGDKLTDAEVTEFMGEADVDKDGTIDEAEFVRAISWGRGDASRK